MKLFAHVDLVNEMRTIMENGEEGLHYEVLVLLEGFDTVDGRGRVEEELVDQQMTSLARKTGLN